MLKEIGVDSFFRDIGNCSDLLGYTIGSAFIIGFIYMIILRFLSGVIVYASIVAVFLGTAGGGYYLYDVSELIVVTEE